MVCSTGVSGSVAERNFRPHVTCCRRTPDNKFVMIVDSGLDQVKIYRFSEKDEHLVQVDTIPCEMESLHVTCVSALMANSSI